jgi:YD repeat-containing protein
MEEITMVGRLLDLVARVKSRATWFLSLVAAVGVLATTAPSVALAEAGKSDAKTAKLLSAIGSKPIAGSFKEWVWQTEWEWQEICHEESYPGYTDRDWDTYTVCEWEYVEVLVLVWVDDPPEECPTAPAPNTPQSSAPPGLDSLKAARISQSALYDKLEFGPGDRLGLAPYRTYQWSPGRRAAAARQKLGAGWYSKWDRYLEIDNGSRRARISRGDGSELVFNKRPDGRWTDANEAGFSLLELGTDSNETGWLLKGPNTMETFDGLGRLTSLASAGESYQLAYSQASGALETVTDFMGRAIRFEYDAAGYVARVIDFGGGATTFRYAGDLMVATYYPNGQWREFSYAPDGKLVYSSRLGGLKSLSNRAGAHGVQAKPTALSCPTPCEPWMRTEISFCIAARQEEKNIRDNGCYVDYESRVNSDPTIAGMAWARLMYDICIADSTYQYAMGVLACRMRYPQCEWF